MNAGKIMVLGLLLFGCGPGQGWQTVEVNSTLGFAVPADREDGEWIKLASGNRIQLRAFELSLDAFMQQSEAFSDSEIDPENPPDGYHNCHNGHCHRLSDNALIDYADILAETATSAQQNVAIIASIDTARTSILETKELNVSCSLCEIEDLPITGVSWAVRDIQIQGTYAIPLSNSESLIEGSFEWSVTETISANQALFLEYDPEIASFELNADFVISPAVFDDVDFASLTTSDVYPEMLLEGLREQLAPEIEKVAGKQE